MADIKYIKTDCDFIDGAFVIAKWKRQENDGVKCKLKKEDKKWYLLQDVHNGSVPKDKEGFVYGWCLGSSWCVGGDDIIEMYYVNKNFEVGPKIKIVAEKSWKDFEDALGKVKEFAEGLKTIEEVDALKDKIKRLIK